MKTILAIDRVLPDLNCNLSDWASHQIWGDERGFGPCMTLGVSDGSKLIAVVVYHNHHPENGIVELSAAAIDRRWLTGPVLTEMFTHAFDGLDCQLVVLRVAPSEKHLKRMLKAYGFQCYTIPRLRGRFEDELIFTLTDNDWRTNKFNMRLSNGQKLSEAARPGPNRLSGKLHKPELRNSKCVHGQHIGEGSERVNDGGPDRGTSPVRSLHEGVEQHPDVYSHYYAFA
jgi:RimJ/RimL family protein N-acetyltransferase